MIDRSICCVFYYNENYTPFSECRGREKRKKSGTKIAYEYAVKKKKQVINVYSAETAGAPGTFIKRTPRVAVNAAPGVTVGTGGGVFRLPVHFYRKILAKELSDSAKFPFFI